MTLPDRFWAKVDLTLGCWLWTGATGATGYGRFLVGRRNSLAHRVAYEALVGPVPEGLELDHLCRTRNCVNPGHMEPVTHAENVRRELRPEITHCVRGHEFTPENTYRQSNGGRGCVVCRRVHVANHRKRQIAKAGAPSI